MKLLVTIYQGSVEIDVLWLSCIIKMVERLVLRESIVGASMMS